MTTYLVRNKDNHQIHGLFVAQSLYDLFWMVDEGDDPYRYEFKRVSYGGIFFTSSEAPVPNANRGDAESDFEIEGEDCTARLTEHLSEVWETSTTGWKPITSEHGVWVSDSDKKTTQKETR